METRKTQATETSKIAISALADLARILGRQAARVSAEAEQADPITPLNKDEGARDD